MSAKRVLFVILVVSLVVLAVGAGPKTASTAQALRSAPQSDPPGVIIPYTGRLADQAGQPTTDGTYDFAFALYATETGGQPLWSEVQEGIVVRSGVFVTSLGSIKPIPGEAAESDLWWLAVKVRGPGEAEFTTLTPRQRLSATAPATPSSLTNGAACPHDHWGEEWIGNGRGLYLRSADNIGIKGLSGTEDGVVGETSASGRSGVFGHSTDGIGVTGRSTNSYGVQGFGSCGVYGNGSTGVMGHGTAYGIIGEGAPGYASVIGVFGKGINATGVLGESDSGGAVGAWSKSGPGLVARSESSDIILGLGSNTADVEFKVDNDGDVYADRAYHCGLGTGAEPGICVIQNSAASDFAEMLPCHEGVEPGDVLVIGPDGRLTRSTEAYQTSVLGVYSAAPGYLGGGKHWQQDGYAPLAVVGIVPVKASAENGPIIPGDLLAAASIPGHAMKAGPNPPQGTVLGKALEGQDAGTGVIKMLATLQ
jgi:hypothetical protein